jgi:transposase
VEVSNNNHAERILRFSVLWRKRSQGTASEKRQPLDGRVPVPQTNLQVAVPCDFFTTTVDALQHYFNGTQPDLSWIQA